MRKRSNRLVVLGLVGAGMAMALGLAALGLRDSVAFFRTPSQLLGGEVALGQPLSVGGLVELGSVRQDGEEMAFRLVDDVDGILVRYSGPVPDLFREGQCVIARGALQEPGVFVAQRVLARHDENYQPREVDAAPRLATSCGPASQPAAADA